MLKEEFYIQQETIPEGKVAIGHCMSIPDRIGRLQVLTDRYQKQGYLESVAEVAVECSPEEVLNGGIDLIMSLFPPEVYESFVGGDGVLARFPESSRLFIDKYLWQSVEFTARYGDNYAGSVRIILCGEEYPFNLPTLDSEEIEIYPDWQEKAQVVRAELSQFAKAKGAPATVAIGLLRAAVLYSKAMGIDVWLGTTDAAVHRLLNGTYFNFNLPKIGDTVFYLGSQSTPVYIHLDNALDNAEQKPESEQVSKFIRGKIKDEFDWYIGV